MVLRIPLLLIATAALTASARAQAPPQPSASVEGVVMKLGTGEPLAGAAVQLNSLLTGDPSGWNIGRQIRRTAKSDQNGRFVFGSVPPGEYRLIATFEGEYVPAEYGQRSPTGEGIPLDISAGRPITGIQLALSPTSAISGRIYDRDGEPLANAQVFALRPAYKNGRRTLTIIQSAETNDRGEYRLFWLAPGSYYVGALADIPENEMNMPSVRISPATRVGSYQHGSKPIVHRRKLKTGEVVEEMFLPIYYPNATDMNSAAPIPLAAGTTAGGVDLAVGAALVRPRHIRGRVFDQTTGQPAAGVLLQAIPRTIGPFFAIPETRSNADGSFDIPGVTPGWYQILANEPYRLPLDGVASVEIADKDIENIPIVLTSGFRLSGRFVLDSGTPAGNKTWTVFPVISIARDLPVPDYPTGFISQHLTTAKPDGSFTIPSVPPGDFRVILRQIPPGGYIRSMRMGNADILSDGLRVAGPPDSVLEIVIGTNAGRLEGSVVNSRGEVLPNRTVVLVPDVRLRQRSDLYKVASTNTAGRFRMQGIAPGDYKLFAWENIEPDAWQDPNFIQTYENAGRPIRIDEGDTENIQVQVIP